MTDIHSELTSLSVTLSPSPAPRLIVLMPYLEAEPLLALQRIWKLADARAAHVLFIGLYDDAADEPGLRRQLATMAASVRDDRIVTEELAVHGDDWVGAVRAHWQAGDTVVCFEEQHSHLQQSDLNVPFYILSSSELRRHARPKPLRRAIGWIGSLGLIVGFSMLQIKIHAITGNFVSNFLMILSLLVEFWMLWAWNQLSF